MREEGKKPSVSLVDLPEFREGSIEFAKTLSGCPSCAIKLALELADSNSIEDRQILKKVLMELAKNLSQKTSEREYLSREFPFIEAWLKGEIGLGFIAKLLEVERK
jgi:hypothetical protein